MIIENKLTGNSTEFSLVSHLINYIIFLFLWILISSLYVFYVKGYDKIVEMGKFNPLFLLLFMLVFLLFALNKSGGGFSKMWKVITGKKLFSILFGEFQVWTILGYVLIIFIYKGDIVPSFLIHLSILAFSINYILLLSIYILNLKLSQHDKTKIKLKGGYKKNENI